MEFRRVLFRSDGGGDGGDPDESGSDRGGPGQTGKRRYASDASGGDRGDASGGDRGVAQAAFRRRCGGGALQSRRCRTSDHGQVERPGDRGETQGAGPVAAKRPAGSGGQGGSDRALARRGDAAPGALTSLQARGISMVTRSPGRAFSARICPWWRLTLLLAILRPNPMPPVSAWRAESTRKKGRKILDNASSGTPGP